MKKSTWVYVGAAAIAVAIIGIKIFGPEQVQKKEWAAKRAALVTKPVAAVEDKAAANSVPEFAPMPLREKKNADTASAIAEEKPTAKPQKAASPANKPAKAKEPIQDPDARAALALVGADPNAEAYWMGAINNPALPPNERKDLIEDLNEDGFSDPKRPGPEDLPLIVSRIELIEELAPYAMDQVNADAFAEAYKDLIDMLDGKPVR